MGRPSGDCNCHCGSGTGVGGSGNFPPIASGADPGCPLLCTHGFLFGVFAPMSYPSWVTNDEWNVNTISYKSLIENYDGQNPPFENTEIKLSTFYNFSVYHSQYGSENIPLGSGHRFVLVSPYTVGTENHNIFTSGQHYILNTSGVPFRIFRDNLSYSGEEKLLCANEQGVMNLQNFNSFSIVPEFTSTPELISISDNLNPFLFSDYYTTIPDFNSFSCSENYFYQIANQRFPLTLGFRKLSLQYHDTVNNKYYWIPYLNESDLCTIYGYNWYNYWYDNWSGWYFYAGIYLGNYAIAPVFNNGKWEVTYPHTKLYIDYQNNKMGYPYNWDPEYGPCYYYYVSQNASDTNLYFNPGEAIDINILAYLSAQGLELGGGLSLLYSAYISDQHSEQWSLLSDIGLNYCIKSGRIFGTPTTNCGYVPPFEIDIYIETCCGQLYVATMYITFNQTEC